MKNSLVIIIIIVVAILGFLIGYSLAPTDLSTVRHEVASGGHGAAGDDSGALAGGYGGQAAGGYGAPAAGGYGAPAAGGYGAPAGGYGQ